MKACIAAALCLISGASAAESPVSPQVLAASPVLVELFTSEGCSSCPPADDALRSMARSQPVQGARIIALGFHVDYWDQLGWRDAYSSSAFTARQVAYGEAFHLQGVYTPQLVVDGTRQLIGGSSEAKEEIALAAHRAKAKVHLSVHATGDASVELQVAASQLPPVSAGDQMELWLAITEDDLRSNVLRGENSGRQLTHAAVVRRLELFARLAKGEREISSRRTERLDPSWKPEHLNAVAFLQEKKSRRVLGLAAVSLAAVR